MPADLQSTSESRGLRTSETSLRLDAAYASVVTPPYMHVSLMTVHHIDWACQKANFFLRSPQHSMLLLT